MKKFDINTRVAVKSQVEAYPNYNVGTVLAHTEGVLDVFHVVEFNYGQCAKLKPEDLVTEAEAKEIRARLNAEQAKLDEEFTEVRKQIKDKLDQASALIEESAALAREHKKHLDNLYPEISELYDTLSDIGWISSSTNC